MFSRKLKTILSTILFLAALPLSVGSAFALPPPPTPTTLDIVKTGPATAQRGDIITYNIVVTNNMTTGTTDTIIADTFLNVSGMTFIPEGSTDGCLKPVGENYVVCPPVSYAPGTSKSFTLKFQIPANIACGTVIMNQADTHTPNLAPSWGKAMTTVACANPPQCSDGIDNDGDGCIDFPLDTGCDDPNDDDEKNDKGKLTIIKTGPATIEPGGIIAYNILVSNNTATAADNTLVADIFPHTNGMTYIPSGSSAGCLIPSGETYVVCPPVNYAPGESKNYTIRFQIPASAACDSVILNRGEVHTPGREPNWSKFSTTVKCIVPEYIPECRDGKDNDGDGLIDFPSDPNCDSPDDDSEAGVLTPYADCIEPTTGGAYIARFGYQNTAKETVNLGVGATNQFTPGAQNRGQVTQFVTGKITNAFQVVFDGKDLTWKLGNLTATANLSTVSCNPTGPIPNSCVDTNITDLLVTLDTGIQLQQKEIDRAARKYLALNKKPATAKYVATLSRQASELYKLGWNTTWTIPRLITNCVNLTQCVQADNLGKVAQFLSYSKGMVDLSNQLAKKLNKLKTSQAKKVSKSLTTRVKRQHEENIKHAGQVPRFDDQC